MLIEIKYIFIGQKDSILLWDTVDYPERHVQVVDHNAGSVSSRNFNAGLALQLNPRLYLYNHGVTKIIDIQGNCYKIIT